VAVTFAVSCVRNCNIHHWNKKLEKKENYKLRFPDCSVVEKNKQNNQANIEKGSKVNMKLLFFL
jgi:hypothetical protein